MAMDFLSCSRQIPSIVFKGFEQKTHIIKGSIEYKGNCSKIHCEQSLKKAILDKFLYHGFEGTSYWRPRPLTRQSLSDELRINLLNQVYILDLKSEDSSTVKIATFQFNINSILILLEHEGIIVPLGY